MTPLQKNENLWFWIHRIAVLTMPPMLAITGWILSMVWTRIERMDSELRALEIKAAHSSATTFSAAEWATAKARIDEDRSNLDRRVTRLEEAVPTIKETLMRIEEKIDVYNER